MNSLLAEIYSTIIPSAPYIIAAYALIMIILFVFLGVTFSKIKKAEQKLDLLEAHIAEVHINEKA